jgi:methionyl-tRNA formyltransferase
MFDTIILLAGPVEAGALSTALLRHNPHLTLHLAKTLDDLDAIGPRRLRRARLLSFASPVIVPRRILDRLGFGGFNFHPGPPSYPGWAPAYFATYDRATTFGVTTHVMYERVDSGPIVAVDLFDVPATNSAETLEATAYARLTRQFFELAKPFATSPHAPEPLPVQWCGRRNTQRQLAKLCNIPADISREELERCVSAFGGEHRSLLPTLTLHGYQFRYVGAETTHLAKAAEINTARPVAAIRA